MQSFLGFETYDSDEKHLIMQCYNETFPNSDDFSSLKNFVDSGRMWGVWKDEESKQFCQGKNMTINQNGKWYFEGSESRYLWSWNGTNKFILNEHNITVTIKDEKTILLTEEGGANAKWKLVK